MFFLDSSSFTLKLRSRHLVPGAGQSLYGTIFLTLISWWPAPHKQMSTAARGNHSLRWSSGQVYKGYVSFVNNEGCQFTITALISSLLPYILLSRPTPPQPCCFQPSPGSPSSSHLSKPSRFPKAHRPLNTFVAPLMMAPRILERYPRAHRSTRAAFQHST